MLCSSVTITEHGNRSCISDCFGGYSMQHDYLPPCLLRSHLVYPLTEKQKQNIKEMQRFRSPLFVEEMSK